MIDPSDQDGSRATAGRGAIAPEWQADAEPTIRAPPEPSPFRMAAPSDTMGLRHVAIALADLPFPATKAEILGRAGAWRMPVTGTHFHPLSQFLEGVPEKRYRSLHALMRAVERAHPDLRP